MSSKLHSRQPKKSVYCRPTYSVPVLNMHSEYDSYKLQPISDESVFSPPEEIPIWPLTFIRMF